MTNRELSQNYVWWRDENGKLKLMTMPIPKSKFNPDWDQLAACKECLQEYMEEIKKLKKEWVGLTDEEIKSVSRLGVYEKPLIEFARAIEAKLKDKNT